MVHCNDIFIIGFLFHLSVRWQALAVHEESIPEIIRILLKHSCSRVQLHSEENGPAAAPHVCDPRCIALCVWSFYHLQKSFGVFSFAYAGVRLHSGVARPEAALSRVRSDASLLRKMDSNSNVTKSKKTGSSGIKDAEGSAESNQPDVSSHERVSGRGTVLLAVQVGFRSC